MSPASFRRARTSARGAFSFLARKKISGAEKAWRWMRG